MTTTLRPPVAIAWRPAVIERIVAQTAAREELLPAVRPPPARGRPARRRASHRPRRLPGAAQLLHRVGAGAPSIELAIEEARRRRGVALFPRSRARRRHLRGARSHRRPLRVARARRRPAAARRRRLGRRAAGGDAARADGDRAGHPGAARLLGAHMGRCDLSRRAAAGRPRRSRFTSCSPPRAGRRRARATASGASIARCSTASSRAGDACRGMRTSAGATRSWAACRRRWCAQACRRRRYERSDTADSARDPPRRCRNRRLSPRPSRRQDMLISNALNINGCRAGPRGGVWLASASARRHTGAEHACASPYATTGARHD